jgi:ABC-type antimicrobial peptide transport system permease subunit
MGADPRDVIMLISRQGLAPAFAGLALGLLLALGATRFIGHLLYTVSLYDPAVFGSAAIALTIVSALAAGISAYRACRVDASTILK